jgi:SAM-dependent methyltransferase
MTRTAPDPKAIGLAYDDGAADFDARFEANRGTVARFGILDRVQREICRGRVLELGCGTGRFLRTLDSAIGIDVSQQLLAQAVTRGLSVARADAHRLPFAAESFDAITGGNAVFRYLDYPRVFAEGARVLRRGGHLAVHVYAARPWPGKTGDPLDVTSFGEIRAPAERAGFREIDLRLWRAIRFPPYLIPLWPRLAWRLWHHAIFIFEKRM